MNDKRIKKGITKIGKKKEEGKRKRMTKKGQENGEGNERQKV